MSNFTSYLKSLPVSTRRLLGLGTVAALFVALPLFVWGILTQRFDIRERAQAVPSTCVPVNNVINVIPEGDSTTCHDIQAAVDAVVGDGYTVQLTAGEYFVPNQINIQNKTNITIKGDETSGSGAVVLNFNPGGGFNFLIQNSSGAIQWMTIQGGSSNGMLSIHNSSNFSVEYLSAYSQTSHTLDIQNSYNISVYNTELQSSAGALEVSNSEVVNISNNRIHNSANAIAYFNSGGKIHSNLIYNNSESAIVLNKPTSIEVYSNTIADNGLESPDSAGINIFGVEPIYSTILNINKNIIANNRIGLKIDSFNDIDTFNFAFNDVWNNQQENYSGIANQTGINGNISSNPLFGLDYCVYYGSPVLYGLVSNGEYMGNRLYCSGTMTPTPTPTITATATPTATATASPTATATATAIATSTATATASANTAPGDVNGDGSVNIVDLGIIIDHYGEENPSFAGSDLNHDGIVNIIDIGIVIDNY